MINSKCMITLIALLCLPMGAISASEKVDTITMAVTDWPPFTIGKQAPFSGIDVDIARILEKELNLKVRFRPCPFKRCLEEMRNGAIDLMSGIAMNDERKQYLDYIPHPYAQVSVAFYVPLDKRQLIQQYEDLKDLYIGFVYGSHYFEPFNSDDSLKKVGVYRESLLLPMLARGRIDTMIGTSPNLEYEIKQAGYSGQFEAVAYDPKQNVDIYFALSKKSELRSYKAKLKAFIQRLDQTGKLQEIYANYR